MQARPSDTLLEQLIELSRELGRPANDYSILAEGNASADAGDGSFWVKASGTSLRDAQASSFVRIDREKALHLLDEGDLSDDEIKAALQRMSVESTALLPSVETVLHAICLSLDGVQVVGHTHPTAINMITCSNDYEAMLAGRLFPDEIVLCDPTPLLMPYIDPGIPLARELASRLALFRDQHGMNPRTIYLQNHGFIALGASPKQVLDTTAMAVKAARILVGTRALGGPRFLEPRHVERIFRRPDEHYRQRMLEQRSGPSSGA